MTLVLAAKKSHETETSHCPYQKKTPVKHHPLISLNIDVTFASSTCVVEYQYIVEVIGSILVLCQSASCLNAKASWVLFAIVMKFRLLETN